MIQGLDLEKIQGPALHVEGIQLPYLHYGTCDCHGERVFFWEFLSSPGGICVTEGAPSVSFVQEAINWVNQARIGEELANICIYLLVKLKNLPTQCLDELF